MLVAKLQFTFDCQGWTGHNGNAMLVAGRFTISHTKCLKNLLDFLYGMSQLILLIPDADCHAI
jgi:hypothetical protein